MSEQPILVLLAPAGVCLIHQVTIVTVDEIAQMFIKRISKLTTKAKEELER